MLIRYLRFILIATLAISFPVVAHHGAETVAPLQAPGPSAASVTVQGYVDQILIEDKVTGVSRRVPILATDDGRRVVLSGPGVDDLADGTAINVTGKQDGRTLFPDTVQAIATNDARRVLAKATSVTSFAGILRLGHADNFDGTPSEFFYAVDSGNGHHTRLELGTALGGLQNGMRVAIQGRIAASGELAADRISIVAAADAGPKSDPIALATPVTTNYLVIPIKFPTNTAAPFTFGADPFTPDALNTAVFGGAGSVKSYYNEVSYGQQLLSGVVATDGAGGFLQASVVAPANCDYTAIGTAAENAAAARGYNVASYSAILYVFNNVPNCGWSGLAYVGYARAWSNNTTSLLVIAHELGHNFGLAHAASLDCGTTAMCSTGTSSEYGDPFDTMGNNRAMHFNSAQKDILGWLPAGTVSTHTSGTATYTLSPIESAGGAKYAVKVPAAANRTYWIEYRQPIGVDAALSAFPNSGAQIRVASPFEALCSGCFDDTEFLDMTPATTAFTDGALVVGQTYTDSTYNIGINVISASASALTVQVSMTGGAPTSTSLASSLNPSTFGTSVTFTATVTGTGPTGTVSFTDTSSAITGCAAVALAGSGNTRTATCTTSALAAGARSIVATYSGDAGNAGSVSAALSQVVKAISSTTLASSSNPSIVGASVTFTASVTGVAPTGTVNFKDGAASIAACSAVAVTGSGNTRTAVCATSALATGAHSVTAAYGGDAGNVASGSSALSQVVNAGTTASTTTLASSLNPSVSGASVTFTASVTGAAPTGTVNFKDGAASIAGCSAVALTGSGNTRTALCTTSALAVGSHAASASYGGDAGNLASTSSTLAQVVTGVSATTVASSANPANAGASVTFTASVTGVSPTGTINFKDGATPIAGCSAVALTGSGNTRTAACSTSALAAGTHSIVASYAGDFANAASSSSALSQVVKSATTSTLTSSANPSTTGTGVTFTASVTGLTPTGNVNFVDGVTSIAGCSAVALTGSGNTRTALCSTSALAVGTHNISATYAGDAGNLTSTSSTMAQVVTASSTTTVSSSANPATLGASVSFTASVAGLSPTGMVNFKDGLASIAGCSAVALTGSGNTRTAVCTTSALTVGTHSIVAAYGGDSGNLASNSSALSQVVKSTSATTLTSSVNPSNAGASVSFTASVTGQSPSGTVNFTDGGTSIAGCAAVALGGLGNTRVATCSTTALAAGTRSIAATYGGDSGNAGSASSVLAQVVRSATTTSLASSANPSVLGASVTFTATVTGLAPTGTVSFSNGGTSIAGCAAVALSGSGNTRTAACATTTLAAGARSITAAYGGDAGNSASTSSALAQVVKSTSTTALASAANPSVAGSVVTFTATVGGLAPTGSVTFTDGATSIAGCTAVALTGSGNVRTAQCSTPGLAVGTHTIVASYGGDAANVGSTSAALAQVVNPNNPGSANVALASNGGVATASSTSVGLGQSFAVSGVINGDRAGMNWGASGGWKDATSGVFPDWVQINFSGTKTIDHVIVYTLQDNYASPVDPPSGLTFTQYGITDFQVQGWNGSAWVTLGTVSGNNLVKRTVSFAATSTDRIRVNVTGALASFSRITEIEAWTASSSGPAVTTTALASSANPSGVGASLTFTASVSGVGPTGTVNFKDGATSINGCAAVALTGSGDTRTAACVTSSLAAGSHSIVAGYSGDAGNVASASAALSQTITSSAQANVALASNGGVATASSTSVGLGQSFAVSGVINGDRAGMNWGASGGWKDATSGVFPDWVQINFSGTKTIDHVIVYTLQDNYASPVDPPSGLTFTQYGITDFQVQGWNGSAWVTLGTVSGNNLVKRTVSFAATSTDRIRVNVTGALASFSRITEIEAWGN